MSIQDKCSLLRRIEFEIKVGVILTDIIMTFYVLWLIITNDSSWIPGALFGFTPFGAYELYRAGTLFHLCRTHKCMLIHIVAVYCCCIYQAQFGFGDTLAAMRWIMFITGFILMLIITFKALMNYELCYKKNGSKDSKRCCL